MSYLKSHGNALNNDRLLKQYGGREGSGPVARQKYATGGAVKKEGNPSLGEGLAAAADGAPAKPSLSRPGRKMAGKGKDAKRGTTVNIVIAGGKGGPDAGGPPPLPMGGPPPMPPPGPGPGGPPPMPMRANGGRIANLGKYAHGGKICRKEGGPAIGLHEDGKTVGSGGGLGRLAKAKMYGK